MAPYSLDEEKEEQHSLERFSELLSALREKLSSVEERCLDDEILRDAVSIAVEGYCRQIEAIERACERVKAKYVTEEPPNGNDQ